VPVVARGGQFVRPSEPEALAKFLGLDGTGHTPLPPQEILEKWANGLRATQRNCRQLPASQMNLKAIESYDRSIRVVGVHLFSIGQAFLDCVVHGANDVIAQCKKYQVLKDDEYTSGDAIADYGLGVVSRLEQWWNELSDKTCQQRFDISFYGLISTHHLLERCAWHSLHHARQIVDVLDRQGITPNARLTKDDLAGLPLPKEIWP
jgi:hypothetical protein